MVSPNKKVNHFPYYKEDQRRMSFGIQRVKAWFPSCLTVKSKNAKGNPRSFWLLPNEIRFTKYQLGGQKFELFILKHYSWSAQIKRSNLVFQQRRSKSFGSNGFGKGSKRGFRLV